MARILKISISKSKGTRKLNVEYARVIKGRGIEGDAHADTFRALSLLPYESFSKVRDRGLDVSPGDFAENITTIGLDFGALDIGDRIALGESVILEIVQIGKECHDECAIGRITGECIMPREGVFAGVIRGGVLREGDNIAILKSKSDFQPNDYVGRCI